MTQDNIMELETEKLHYHLRLNPEEALNDTWHIAIQGRYFTDPTLNFQFQVEVWQFLNDEDAHPFIPSKVEQFRRQGENRLQKLRLAAEQIEISDHAAQFFARSHIPEPDGAIVAARSEDLAIRAEGQSRVGAVAAQRVQFRAGGGVPELDHTVYGSRCEARAVWAESQRIRASCPQRRSPRARLRVA